LESFPRPFPAIRSVYKFRLCLRVGASGLPWLLPFGATRGCSRGRHFSLNMLHDSSLCGVHFRIPNNRSLSDVARSCLRNRMRSAQCASVMESHQSVQFSCCPGCSKIAAFLSMSEIAILRQVIGRLTSCPPKKERFCAIRR
jgi:hypothetical protein